MEKRLEVDRPTDPAGSARADGGETTRSARAAWGQPGRGEGPTTETGLQTTSRIPGTRATGQPAAFGPKDGTPLGGDEGGNACVGATWMVSEASWLATVTAAPVLPPRSQRQGGNGRSDAARLLARNKPSKGVNALRGARRPPKSILGSATWLPKRNAANPRSGTRLQYAWSPRTGANRRSGEKPQGRNATSVVWQPRSNGFFGIPEWTARGSNGGGAVREPHGRRNFGSRCFPGASNL